MVYTNHSCPKSVTVAQIRHEDESADEKGYTQSIVSFFRLRGVGGHLFTHHVLIASPTELRTG